MSDIVINSYNLEDISSMVGNTEANMDENKQKFERDFKNLGEANLFVGGLDKMDKKMARIQNKMRVLNNAIKTNNEQIALLEQMLKNEIESVEIPKDFKINNVANNVSYGALGMGKVDGRAVTEGTLNQIDETQAESIISRNENLKDITKDTNLDTKVLNDYTVERQNLTNINNEKEQTEVKYDDSSSISGQEKLYDISNQNSDTLQNAEININGNKTNINDISGSTIGNLEV